MARPAKQPRPRKPARPSNLPQGRWLGDFPGLTKAEKELVSCCARGKGWMPPGWDWKEPVRPDKATPANTIRAELIRFLALGGDDLHPVHEEGVQIWGGWVKGALNLHQCLAPRRLDLKHCFFEQTPIFLGAQLPELALSGSQVPGLLADAVKVTGDVFLREGFFGDGEVRLVDATIGGQLDCNGGAFMQAHEQGAALNADGINVAGNVYLGEGFHAEGEVRLLSASIGRDLHCIGGAFNDPRGQSAALNADGINVVGSVNLSDGFRADGEVRFLRSNIGGHLYCDGGSFKYMHPLRPAVLADEARVLGSVFLRFGFVAEGEVNITGARIGGSLYCSGGEFLNPKGCALNVDKSNVEGSLFLRGATVRGGITLTSARVDTIIDDSFDWSSGGHLLDGFRYNRIVGPCDADSRIGWLNLQRADQLDACGWKPQPWEQIVKVLREMGHPAAAAEVAIEKQRMMRHAGQIGGPLQRALHRLYEFMAGYGYRPIQIVWRMVWVWLACAFFFQIGGSYGYMGPTTPLLNNAEIAAPALSECGHRFERDKIPWTRCAAMPAEYTTFQPLIYSLDVILPLVDLKQEEDWAPIVEDPPGNDLGYGAFIRWLMWFEIVFGWVASLMFVAIVSRLVERD